MIATFLLGLAIALHGAYLTGTTRVSCSKPTSSGAECRVEVRRWLGKSVVERDLVNGVYGAATQSSTRKVTDNPTSPPLQRTTREVKDSSLVLTGREGTWLKQLEGGQGQVERAQVRLTAHMAGPTVDEVTVALDVTGTMYMAVGVFVFLAGFAIPKRHR